MQDLKAGSIRGRTPEPSSSAKPPVVSPGALSAFTVFLLRKAFGTMGPGAELPPPGIRRQKHDRRSPDRLLAGLAGGFVLSLVVSPA